MQYFWNIETLISMRRMKLDTSNVEHRWTAVSTNEKCKISSKWVMCSSRDQRLDLVSEQWVLTKKMQKLGQRGHVEVMWPTLEFVDPIISPERLKVEFSNSAQRWTAMSTNAKKCKIRPKEVKWVSLDTQFECWDPPDFSGTNEARNVKYGTHMDVTHKMKNYDKRSHVGSRDPFSDPLVSKERLKLEFWNLAQRWMAVSNNVKHAILGQKGSCGGHVTHFSNTFDPVVCGRRLKLEISHLTQRWMAVITNAEKCKIRPNGVMWLSRDPLF